MRFPAQSHVILQLTAGLGSTLTVKTFSDILPCSSVEALWLMKHDKVKQGKICGWAKSTSEEIE